MQPRGGTHLDPHSPSLLTWLAIQGCGFLNDRHDCAFSQQETGASPEGWGEALESQGFLPQCWRLLRADPTGRNTIIPVATSAAKRDTSLYPRASVAHREQGQSLGEAYVAGEFHLTQSLTGSPLFTPETPRPTQEDQGGQSGHSQPGCPLLLRGTGFVPAQLCCIRPRNLSALRLILPPVGWRDRESG